MAGRSPKPWYRADRGAWYVVIDGKRVKLGPDRDEAFRAFHRLMSGEESTNGELPAVELAPLPRNHIPEADTTPQLPTAGGVLFGELIRRYLAALKKTTKPRTHYVADCYLKPFVARLAAVPAAALTVDHIDHAIAEHAAWNQTTENHVRCRLMAALNWAVVAKLIRANPLTGMKKPPAIPRGAAAAIDPADAERLIAASPSYLRDVLVALHQTGARPCEVLTVTAADYDRKAAVWVLREHKTAHRGVGVRVVHLTPAVVEICDRLVKANPSGPLFRRHSGRPFPEGYYLARLVACVRKRVGLPATITPYSFRHGFCTDALARGVPDALVAELVGHQGTAMLHKHYAHLVAKTAVLKGALGDVRGGEANKS